MILFSGKLFHLRLSTGRNSSHLSTFYPPILFPLYSTTETLSVKSTFIVDYLISTVGLSPEAAIKSSKFLSHLKSPSKPDSVLHFLKASGFNDAEIKNMIVKNSTLLTAKLETTLKPNMVALKEFGFSELEILHLVSRNPMLLIRGGIQSKIEFWRVFLRSKENLLNALHRGRRLISYNLDTNIMPKISFLRDCGISDQKISSMINNNPNFITKNLDSIKSLVKLAEELGIPYGSAAFCAVLVCLSQISRATLGSKLKLLRSFGWSEDGISLAIRKTPILLETSEKKMKVMIDFFVKQAGCEPSYVMTHPLLMTFSLERRMIPRHHVLQFLLSKDMLKKKFSFYSFMIMPEKKFIEKYILSYREKIPELGRVYPAVCVGN